jgi:hypothetical protein
VRWVQIGNAESACRPYSQQQKGSNCSDHVDYFGAPRTLKQQPSALVSWWAFFFRNMLTTTNPDYQGYDFIRKVREMK